MSDDEKKTLCALIEEELHVTAPNEYISLIQPATHYCKGCGRTVADPENVCKPEELT